MISRCLRHAGSGQDSSDDSNHCRPRKIRQVLHEPVLLLTHQFLDRCLEFSDTQENTSTDREHNTDHRTAGISLHCHTDRDTDWGNKSVPMTQRASLIQIDSPSRIVHLVT